MLRKLVILHVELWGKLHVTWWVFVYVCVFVLAYFAIFLSLRFLTPLPPFKESNRYMFPFLGETEHFFVPKMAEILLFCMWKLIKFCQ